MGITCEESTKLLMMNTGLRHTVKLEVSATSLAVKPVQAVWNQANSASSIE